MNKSQKEIYNNISKTKDKFLRFFAFLFTKLHITANQITFLGIVFMLLFIAFIKVNILLSGLFLIISILCDGLDGVLARYQKTASDKGKFIDIVTDNFNTFLFVIGIAYAGIANVLYLIPYVYLMLLSKSLRVFVNSFDYKSDWYFKGVAGLLPNLVNYTGYGLFLVSIIFLPTIILDYFFALGSLILIGDSIYYFFKIINLRI